MYITFSEIVQILFYEIHVFFCVWNPVRSIILCDLGNLKLFKKKTKQNHISSFSINNNPNKKFRTKLDVVLQNYSIIINFSGI